MRVDPDISGRAAVLATSAAGVLSLSAVLVLQGPCALAASRLVAQPSTARAEDVGGRRIRPEATASEHCEGCRNRTPNGVARHADFTDHAMADHRRDMDEGADELLVLAGAVSFAAVVVVALAGFFGHRERARSSARHGRQDRKDSQKS
jgi:hypothetical protein